MLDSIFTVVLISLGLEHTACLMGFDRILVVRGSGLPSQLVTAWYHSARQPLEAFLVFLLGETRYVQLGGF